MCTQADRKFYWEMAPDHMVQNQYRKASWKKDIEHSNYGSFVGGDLFHILSII